MPPLEALVAWTTDLVEAMGWQHGLGDALSPSPHQATYAPVIGATAQLMDTGNSGTIRADKLIRKRSAFGKVGTSMLLDASLQGGLGCPPSTAESCCGRNCPSRQLEHRGVRRFVTTICLGAEDALGVGVGKERATGSWSAPTEWTRPTDRRQSGQPRSQDIRLRGGFRITGDAYVDGKDRAMFAWSRVM
jgi:hypothetical protein